jgi:hypothetical protein
MRILAAFGFLAGIAAGEAQASSFVAPEPMTESVGPSMIVLGAPAAAPQEPATPSTAQPASPAYPSLTFMSGSSSQANPSIVVLGEPAGISSDAVAAIPQPTEKRASSMGAMPMVIRGGLVGEGYGRSAPSGASQASAPEAPRLDPNDKGTPAKRKALKRLRQQQREQASAPAAAPEPAAPAGE